MTWLIAKKEFFSNLVNFRFIAGFTLCLVLSALSAWILIYDYAERIDEYSNDVQKHKEELGKAQVYSEVKVTIDKRPEPLGLLCEGVEKYLEGTVTIWYGEVPMVASSAGQGNPLMAGLPSLDLSMIVRVIFSLLALLFVYDSISRERERGTLSLMMSNPVPRHQVLFGKYLGTLMSLFVPILCSMLAGGIIILLSSAVELGPADGVRLVLICLVSLLYVSIFCTVGIFVSSRCNRSKISLMFLLFLWVAFVFLIPKASAYIASYARPVSSLDVVNERIDDLWHEFQDKADEFNEEHPVEGTTVFGGTDKIFLSEKRAMTARLKRVRYRIPLRIHYADKVHSVRQEYLQQLQSQSALANNLARISPSVNYENLISALARTDAQSHLWFVEYTRNYRRELISYLRSKKAFTSFLFFTRQREEEMFDGEEFQKWFRGKYWGEWGPYFRGEKNISELWKRVWDPVEPLELEDLPKSQFEESSIVHSIGNAIVDLVILAVLNVLLFLLAHASFLKGGVKA